MGSGDFTVIALLAAYNEADVIGEAISHLVEQGVSVHLIDDGSTDGTADAAAPFLGRGLRTIERRPVTEPHRYSWKEILARKQKLAQELDADWFLHHDADEFRESPWAGRTLAQALQTVDRLGYDAVDFEVLNFPPTRERAPGESVRAAFDRWEASASFDKLQVKAWKRTEVLDLVSSGGHEAVFPGRRVFPVRFLLRHYPIRGQRHGTRKVEDERKPCFDPEERARGWHKQYDDWSAGHSFLRDPNTLTPYDADAVRLSLFLHNRLMEELEAAPATRDRLLDETRRELNLLRTELDARHHEVERIRGEAEQVRREFDDVLASKSWRWTAPLRRLLGGPG